MSSDTRPATDAHMRNAAITATNDPKALDRAARIVRAAIASGKLTPADLSGPIVPKQEA